MHLRCQWELGGHIRRLALSFDTRIWSLYLLLFSSTWYIVPAPLFYPHIQYPPPLAISLSLTQYLVVPPFSHNGYFFCCLFGFFLFFCFVLGLFSVLFF